MKKLSLEEKKNFLLEVGRLIKGKEYAGAIETAIIYDKMLKLSENRMVILAEQEFMALQTELRYRGDKHLNENLHSGLLCGEIHIREKNFCGLGYGIFCTDDVEVARNYGGKDDKNVFVSKFSPNAKIAKRYEIVDSLKETVNRILEEETDYHSELIVLAENFLIKRNPAAFAAFMGYHAMDNLILNRKEVVTTPPYNLAQLQKSMPSLARKT